jgi:hypothetical protein
MFLDPQTGQDVEQGGRPDRLALRQDQLTEHSHQQ